MLAAWILRATDLMNTSLISSNENEGLYFYSLEDQSSSNEGLVFTRDWMEERAKLKYCIYLQEQELHEKAVLAEENANLIAKVKKCIYCFQ